VVVGGSTDTVKPGGKVLANLLAGSFEGDVYVLNPKETSVQGVRSFARAADLPSADLAIVAIAAKHVVPVVRDLVGRQGTRSFIVLSAGFGEENEEGRRLEAELVRTVDEAKACLIGPNCIGVMTPAYQGVFTSPVPKLVPQGCDFISGSGSTACFIMELGIPVGLTFSSVFSVGNSAQTGIEDILEYLDDRFDPVKSSRVKLIYAEKIAAPKKLLKHSASLIRKGCRIAAIKAGASEAGIRAATSHTGALARSDTAVDALLRKAGIVRCASKEELVNVACVFMHRPLKGPRIAVITNAGGPGVMAADALTQEGLEVPHFDEPKLLSQLLPGSSTANPIDFLATGTARHMEAVLTHVERLPGVDGVMAIFGTPGMTATFDCHEALLKRWKTGSRPLYVVLPSPSTAKSELDTFLAGGGIYFHDEVSLARAMARSYHTSRPSEEEPVSSIPMPVQEIRQMIAYSRGGFLDPPTVREILTHASIPVVEERLVESGDGVFRAVRELGTPVVMKVVGPLHKTEVKGVEIGLFSDSDLDRAFKRLMSIPGAVGVLVQPMLRGVELFAGAKRESGFGHVVVFGLGGVLVEALRDVAVGLTPLRDSEVEELVNSLRSRSLFESFRNQSFVNKAKFIDIVLRLSKLVEAVPEIDELDLNPMVAGGDSIVTVDARISVSRVATVKLSGQGHENGHSD
jgi:acetyltransferase